MKDYEAELAELMPERTTLPTQGVGINVKRLVKLRGRLMGLAFLVMAIPLTALLWIAIPKEYVASAEIEFKAQVPRMIDGQAREMSPTLYVDYVKTQVKMITGYPILSRVATDPEVLSLPGVPAQGTVAHLMKYIKGDAQEGTHLVQITYRDEIRENAVTILNSVLKHYVAYVRGEEQTTGGLREETLTKNREEMEQEAARLRDEISEKRRVLRVPAGSTPGTEPTETESFRINLAQAEANLTTAETQVRHTEKLLERVEGFIEQHRRSPQSPVFAMGVEEKVNTDPNVLLLAEQLASVQQQYAILQETYVDGAPQLAVKQGELRGAERKMEDVKAQVRGQVLRSLQSQYQYDLSAFETDVEDATNRRDQFAALLEQYRRESLELSHELAVLREMERRHDEVQTRIDRFNAQLLELRVESNRPAQANVLGQASADPEPDITRRLRFIFIAVMGAFSASLVMGLVLESRDQNIRSSMDAAYVTDLPVIASVPHTSEDRLPPDARAPMVAAQHAVSMTADEYRRAVAFLLNTPVTGGHVKSILVTGPARGEGKTSVACNLAVVLAQAGRRVLLVDMDSRNPAVERSFGFAPAAGLAELLAGQQLPHDPERATEFEDLHVLGPGLQRIDLVARLASREIDEFLQGAEDVFDHIVIDTPAALIMSEARLLAPLVDGVIVVAGVGASSFGMLRRCLSTLKDSGGRVLGLIVNGVRQAPGGYLRENVDAYYQQNQGHQRTPGGGRPRRGGEPSVLLMKSGRGTGGDDT